MKKLVGLFCLATASIAINGWALTCPALTTIKYGACPSGTGNCYYDSSDNTWNSSNADSLGGGLLFPTTAMNTLPSKFSRAYVYNVKMAANGVVCQYYTPKGSGLTGLISLSNYQMFPPSPTYTRSGQNWKIWWEGSTDIGFFCLPRKSSACPFVVVTESKGKF